MVVIRDIPDHFISILTAISDIHGHCGGVLVAIGDIHDRRYYDNNM